MRQGGGIQWCQWIAGILYNGLGRYEHALVAAQRASDEATRLHVSAWALAEVIEAASRTGNTQVAVEALGRLDEATSASKADWGLGVLVRSRALLSEGHAAEGAYREPIERLCGD